MEVKSKKNKKEKEVKEEIIETNNSKSLKENKNETSDKLKKYVKGLSTQTKIIIILIIAVVILASIIAISTKSNRGKHTITASSSLEKIIEINELSTVDYTYNAIATKYKNEKKKSEGVEYYVAYEGVVTAGIDFNEMKIDVDEKEKIINITLPEVEIQSVRVNMGTMDYIFVEKQKESDSISQAAYKLCKNDLKERLSKEENLYNNAKENAISAVEGLLKPWIDSLGENYKVIVK